MEGFGFLTEDMLRASVLIPKRKPEAILEFDALPVQVTGSKRPNPTPVDLELEEPEKIIEDHSRFSTIELQDKVNYIINVYILIC